MLRLRATYLATSLAENYRDAGRNVLFLMDSVAAMARRGDRTLGDGAPGESYPPSVFYVLPA